MKKRVAKLLSIALVGTMVVGMTACGDSAGNDGTDDKGSVEAGDNDTTADSDVSVGIVVKTATNAHFQDIAYGAVLAGKDLGIEVRVDNTATESDVEGQITKCENMISAGVDALILTANDSDGVANAVNAAHEAEIPFVTVDTVITNVWGDEEKEYLPNFIGVDHEEMAYNLAKDVFEHLGGGGKVVILRGTDAASSSQERTAGFQRAIEEYADKGIELVESQSANYDQDTAASTMADIIQAHPDVDVVLCCNDLMAVGATSALKENGIAVGPDDVLVAGIDGNYIALQSIDAGEIYATAYDWSILQGYYAVEQAYAMIKGEEVPEETITPDTIITSENIDEYLPHGEEVDNWTMGDLIETVSDYMRNFLELGEGLQAEMDK